MTKLLHRIIIFSFIVLISPTIFAQDLPRHNPVPGGIAIVDLKSNSNTAPEVYFLKRRVMVVKGNKNNWQAVIGIPLSLKKGKYKVSIKTADKKRLAFNVADKEYELRHITINNKRMVSPTKADIERHYKEKPLILAALKTWTERSEVPTAFIFPVKGRLSSQFGLRRIYNKQERIRRHTGLDIAAPNGTVIISPAKGKVIRTGDYFFTGGTVFLDHGQGLITMYCHLSKTDVKAGDVLQQGDRIGEVGSTGRVSGPHLHWVVSLNNTKVEPKLFLPEDPQRTTQ